MGESTIKPGYSRAGRSYAFDILSEISLRATMVCIHELKGSPVTPRADIPGMATSAGFLPKILEVAVMAAIDVTVEAYVQEVG